MAVNERIVTGRKFRRLIDKEAKLWQRISWWTRSNDVECDDGKTVEQKIGDINGITSSLNDRHDLAASISSVNSVNEELQYRIGGFRIYRGDDGNIYIIDENAGADSVPKKLGDGDPETLADGIDDFVFDEDMAYVYVFKVIQQNFELKKGIRIQLPDGREIVTKFKVDSVDEESGLGIKELKMSAISANDSGSMFYTILYLIKDIPAGTKILGRRATTFVFK